jgi:NAD(P)-dependent dehydrogenase (short-subunit alcohol dehydrogenase family)
MTPSKFAGKTAFVTGAASGIGKAVAIGFATEGAEVFAVDINEEGLKTLPENITKIICDLSDRDAAAEAVKKAEAQSNAGHIDILANCAGVPSAGSVTETTIENWDKTLAINLQAPFMTMRTAIPGMIKAGGGIIINVASCAAKVSIPGCAGYCASKAAISHLTQQVAEEYGRNGIRANAVLPGLFETTMSAGGFTDMLAEKGITVRDFMKEAYRHMPLEGPASPERIYGLFSFLASEDSDYITGGEFIIDGGAMVVDPYSIGIEKAKSVML